MKILAVSVSFPPYTSGVATVSHNLATAMVSRGHKVGVICPSETNRHQTRTMGGIIEFRISSIKNPLRSRHFIPRYQPNSIQQIFNEFQPDLIHLHDPSITSYEALFLARRRNIPIIYTQHFLPQFVLSYFPNQIPDSLQPFAKAGVEQLFSLHVNTFLNKCTYLTTPSNTVKKYLQAHGVAVPITAISNGIDLNRFIPGKKKSKLDNHIPRVLYFGRIDKDKSLEALIYASKFITIPCEFIFAGEGKERKKLSHLAASAKVRSDIIFSFPGYIPDDQILPLYRKAILFVMPSCVETQSIVTLQALACGLPVVAVRAGALPELVKHNKNGILVAPNEPSQMAKAIETLLKNRKLSEQFGIESRNIAQSHNIHHTFNNYEKLYTNMNHSLAVT